MLPWSVMGPYSEQRQTWDCFPPGWLRLRVYDTLPTESIAPPTNCIHSLPPLKLSRGFFIYCEVGGDRPKAGVAVRFKYGKESRSESGLLIISPPLRCYIPREGTSLNCLKLPPVGAFYFIRRVLHAIYSILWTGSRTCNIFKFLVIYLFILSICLLPMCASVIFFYVERKKNGL